MTSISIEQIRQHVRMEVQKHLESKNHKMPWVAIAYRGVPGWTGSEIFEEKGFRFRVATAQSLLDLRCQLVGMDPNSIDRLVIVADLPYVNFSADICSRLLNADVREIEPWRVLMTEFMATNADSRIKADHDLALALLQNRPATGFPAMTTGFLDLATFWGCVCIHVLGFPKDDPTPRDILAWSVDDSATARLRATAQSIRVAAQAWLAERNPLLGVLVSIVAKVPASDLIPIGIVCGVVHSENATTHVDLLRSQGRLEQITGHERVSLKDAREWYSESAHVLGTLDIEIQRRLRKRSDALLAQLGCANYSYLSEIIPLGYQQRLIAFASALNQHLENKRSDAELLSAVLDVRQHWDGQADTHRQLKVDMATRLARWLQTPVEVGATLPEMMRLYRDKLAFVDWARHGLVGGDPIAELQQTYAALHQKVLIRREEFNAKFAQLVVNWNRTPDQFPEILRIEDINKRIVAEVATENKVLVLVMDGMSWPVAQELVGHLESQLWTLRSRAIDGINMPGPVMTTVPSVTEYGRTSLLFGQLTRGDASDERTGFAENHDLRSVSSSSNPPILFHKKDLEEPGRQGLGIQIADTISNQKQRIVGVVVNAVDDYLTKDDGGRRNWDLESIRVLGDLLAAAEQSKRAIILCSDHGHILDHWVSGTAGSADGGERWRSGSAKDGECELSGPRVAAYGSSLTAPWTEKLRYSGKKNGYHGGISPQELIAPCLILAKDDLAGWDEIHLSQPSWWRFDNEVIPKVDVAPIVTIAPLPKARGDAPGQLNLFDAPTPPSSTAIPWPQHLLASQTYQSSVKQAGRRCPDDMMVLKLLTALNAAPGHQLSERALAEVLNVPSVRMNGIIAQISRMLNVESYRIISYTDDRGHIRLDRTMAFTQFELGPQS